MIALGPLTRPVGGCVAPTDTITSPTAARTVCGRPCPLQERERCPHGQKGRGYTHRMSFSEYPRLMGPRQRGTEAWQILYGARTARERTNSDAQEVIDHGRPPKLRGLKAFRFLGAIRTVAHLLRRA